MCFNKNELFSIPKDIWTFIISNKTSENENGYYYYSIPIARKFHD